MPDYARIRMTHMLHAGGKREGGREGVIPAKIEPARKRPTNEAGEVQNLNPNPYMES